MTLFGVFGAIAQAPEARPTRPLIVVDDHAYAPFAFLDADGQPRGFTIDLWRLWSERTGVPVEFRLMAWDDALAAVREGKADAVGGLFRTPEREAWFDFTEPLFEFSTSIFFHEQIQGVKELGDLTGFTVGVIRSDSSEELLRTRYPAIDLRVYATMEEMVRAAIAGEIKVFVGDTPVARHYLAKLPGSGEFRECFTPVLDNMQYAAVGKGRAEVLELVRSGFDHISQEEVDQILALWGGMPVTQRIPWKKIGLGLAAMAALACGFVIWNGELRRRVRRATRDLAEERARFERILGITKTNFNIIDAQFNLCYVDPGWRQIYGDPAGKKCHEYFMGREHICEGCGIPEALETKRITVTEEVLPRESNRIVEVHTIPFQDEKGDWLVAEFNVDITQRKRAEMALRQKTEELDQYFSSSLDLLCIANTAGRFIRLNPEWERVLGYSLAELEGRAFLDFVHPDDHAATLDAVSKLDAQQEVLSFENRYRCKDGSYRWIEWRSKPAGKAIYAAARDVTDRKRAEEAIRESEERLDLAMGVANDGLWDWNIAQDEVYFDSRYYSIAGYEPNEFPHRFEEWAKRVHPDDIERSQAAIQAHLSGETAVFDIEFRFRRKNGAWMWIRGRGSIVERDSHGSPVRMLGTHTDITDLKKAEEEQEKLRAQLAQAQKMESVGRLAGGVAHDFNNMLGVILGQAELAMADLDPAQPLFANLLEIRKAAERSADLTRQLLAFARKQTVAPRVLDLNETVDGMLKMLRRLIGEDIDLAWLPGENTGRVKMDPAQVNQILVNLCVNARDAIGDTGRIAIETSAAVLDAAACMRHEGLAPGEYVVLAVSDDGCGMDKETLDRLFEPFFTTKEQGKGTGLGLATVYGIVKQNNGSIYVYSEPGHGTTFKVYLLRYTGRESSTLMNDAGKGSARGHETILLVEDEPGILKMATAMLERQGYAVLAAAMPGEAIRLAEAYTGPIHLLLTDVVMPEMNGRDLAKSLLSLYPNLKRLFMSGYTANVIAHRGVLEDGVHFIQKPFSMNDLVAKVREALDDGGSA